MHTILDGSKALLVDVADILNGASAEYVIVGGWSPFLRNTSEFSHPGTKDVDVLLSDAAASGGIRAFAKALLDKGFVASAKHEFQLLREMDLGGQRLMFNVDLLHPSETERNPEMLVDHLELPVLESTSGDRRFVKTIVLPSSRILFETSLQSEIEVACPLTGRRVSVPLISEAGCLLSKCVR